MFLLFSNVDMCYVIGECSMFGSAETGRGTKRQQFAQRSCTRSCPHYRCQGFQHHILAYCYHMYCILCCYLSINSSRKVSIVSVIIKMCIMYFVYTLNCSKNCSACVLVNFIIIIIVIRNLSIPEGV